MAFAGRDWAVAWAASALELEVELGHLAACISMFSGLLHRQSLEPLKKIHSEHSFASTQASFVFPTSSPTCTTKRIKSKTAHTCINSHTHTWTIHTLTHTVSFTCSSYWGTKNEFITQRRTKSWRQFQMPSQLRSS